MRRIGDHGLGRRFYRRVLFIYVVWATVGLFVVGANIGPLAAGWEDMLFQLFAATVLFVHAAISFGRVRAVLALVLVMTVGGAVEILGARTGFPFGDYAYTGRFGPQIFGDLPLAIPLAWWVIVYSCWYLLRLAAGGAKPLLYCGVAAILAVCIDGVIEPVAWLIRGYWLWQDGAFWYEVPLSNFIAWFWLALLLIILVELCFGNNGRRPPVAAVGYGGPLIVLQLMLATFIVALAVGGLWPAFFLGLAVAGFIFFLGSLAASQSGTAPPPQ
jgi:putative membrane protein